MESKRNIKKNNSIKFGKITPGKKMYTNDKHVKFSPYNEKHHSQKIYIDEKSNDIYVENDSTNDVYINTSDDTAKHIGTSMHIDVDATIARNLNSKNREHHQHHKHHKHHKHQKYNKIITSKKCNTSETCTPSESSTTSGICNTSDSYNGYISQNGKCNDIKPTNQWCDNVCNKCCLSVIEQGKPICKICPRGPRGPTGPTGTQGSTGSTGPTGPCECGCGCVDQMRHLLQQFSNPNQDPFGSSFFSLTSVYADGISFVGSTSYQLAGVTGTGNTGTDSLLIIYDYNQEGKNVYTNVCKICAVGIYDSDAFDPIDYLQEPVPAPIGCEADCERSLRNLLTGFVGDQNLYDITTDAGDTFTGEIVDVQFGVVIMNSGVELFKGDLFISLCHVTSVSLNPIFPPPI